ncbi:MAG: DUF2079 domain-containing protein [Elusimicrobia bacterium]|nr:DUF2079 domain-containing protein [Elusimicrobiota bacterium]
MNNILKRFQKIDKPILAVITGMIIYTIVFTGLCILRYKSFFSYEWEDAATVNQLAWNTAHGNFFYTSIFGAHFTQHVEPLYLLSAIFYRIYPHIYTGFFIFTISNALCALVIYFLTLRELKSKLAGVIFAFTWFLFPPLHYLNLNGFGPIGFVILFLLLAFCYFQKEKYIKFLCILGLILITSEKFAPSVVMFGIYGIIRKRKIRWIMVPVVSGILWMVVCFNFILPDLYIYPDWRPLDQIIGGGTFIGLFKTLLTQPIFVLKVMFSVEHFKFFIRLFSPVYFISFLSPDILLLGLPVFLRILLKEGALLNNQGHWIIGAVPFIFVATIYSYKRIISWVYSLEKIDINLKHKIRYIILILLPVSTLGFGFFGHTNFPGAVRFETDKGDVFVTNIFNKRFYQMEKSDRIIWEIIKVIPKDAPVAASGDLLPQLSSRKKLLEYPFEGHDYLDVDYILINTRIVDYNGGGHYRVFHRNPVINKAMILTHVKSLVDSRKWIIASEVDDFILLKRRE